MADGKRLHLALTREAREIHGLYIPKGQCIIPCAAWEAMQCHKQGGEWSDRDVRIKWKEDGEFFRIEFELPDGTVRSSMKIPKNVMYSFLEEQE